MCRISQGYVKVRIILELGKLVLIYGRSEMLTRCEIALQCSDTARRLDISPSGYCSVWPQKLGILDHYEKDGKVWS